MSDPGDRLAAIRQRRAALESLPWSVHGPDAWNEKRWLVGPLVFPRDRTDEADMEFIAHAPEDIDFLLLQIDRLRGLHADGHATCRVCGEPISKQVGQWWHDETSRDHDATL